MANRTISLAAIKTLQESHALLSKSAGALKFAPNKTFNERISLWQGDITLLGVDAVVNAANKSLLGGGGIDGAIHRAAGRKLLNECRTLGGCETGDAKITGGYNLPARHVIHTVGPIGEIPNKLSSCYRRVLEVVKENNLTSVAFCCISTGIYGYDNSKAAHVALETVREWMEDNHEYVEQ
ncbi:O-acetyl-ADP-ribose deacetylase macrod1, partial [Dissophora globulifera]